MRIVNSWNVTLKVAALKYGPIHLLKALYIIRRIITLGRALTKEEISEISAVTELTPLANVMDTVGEVAMTIYTFYVMKHYDGCSWKNIGHEKKMIGMGKFSKWQFIALAAPFAPILLIAVISRILDASIEDPNMRFNLFENPKIYESFKRSLSSAGLIGMGLSTIYSIGVGFSNDGITWRSKK